MGSRRFTGLVVLLLAIALLPDPARARFLQGEKPSSSEGSPAPTIATGGSEKSATSKESGHAAQNPDKQPKQAPSQETTQTTKDSPPPPLGVPEEDGSKPQVSVPPVPSTTVRKESPPPGGPEPSGQSGQEGGIPEKPTDESKQVVKCHDPVYTCLVPGELYACLQVSQTASAGQFVIVQNRGQNTVTVNVKATPDISIEPKLPPLRKGESKRINISYMNPNGGEISLNVGTKHCVLRTRQAVSNWQQQFQQLGAYATSMKPIYGAYFFVFTVVLVGAICACCKFARRRSNDGITYQQLEMGSQAPDTSGANNTTSTVNGWEDGWDDDWDDDEAPAKSPEKVPAGSVSANGLSLRSQTNSKDGWDVDWDD